MGLYTCQKNGFIKAGYSNWGKELDFVSPTLFGEEGTSFAQPVTAGALSLLMSRYGKLNHEQCYGYAKVHTLDLYEQGFDKQTGYGLTRLGNVDEDWRFEDMIHTDYRPCETQRITSHYGPRPHPITGEPDIHKGTDLAPEVKVQEPIVAIAKGIVEQSYYSQSGGNLILINHGDFKSRYLHLSKRLVEVGEEVQAGNQIGNMGTTGQSTGEHLHFEIHHYGKPVDPESYLNRPFEVIERGGDVTEERVREIVKEEIQKALFSTDQTEPEYAEVAWKKAGPEGKKVNDGKDPNRIVTEAQLMVFFDRMGFLD